MTSVSKSPSGGTPVPPRRGKKAGRPAAARGNGKPPGGRPPGGGGGNGRGSGGGGGRGPSGPQARQAQHRRNQLMAIVAVAVVVVVVVVLVVVKVAGGSSSPLRKPAPQAAVEKMTHVPLSVLTAAASEVGTSNLVPAQPDPSKVILTKGGKPEVLYVGAEFCPICGAERWPMIIALSHFGTFTNLQQTHSALQDGNVPTWSFYGATYTSPYLAFQSYEVETNTYKNLETPPPNIMSMWTAFFKGQPAFPYINIGGKEVLASSQYPYTSLEEKPFNSVLSAVGTNNNTIGAAIDASAAVLTKYFCGLTNNAPAATCSAVANVSAPVVANAGGQTSTATGG